MAKKGNRQLIGLVCSVCKNRNYITSKNKQSLPRRGKLEQKEKLILSKFCKHCKKHTEHQETTKLD